MLDVLGCDWHKRLSDCHASFIEVTLHSDVRSVLHAAIGNSLFEFSANWIPVNRVWADRDNAFGIFWGVAHVVTAFCVA